MLTSQHAVFERMVLANVIVVTLIATCLSLAKLSPYLAFHILYNDAHLSQALLWTTSFGALSILFVIAPFSFGYFVGFHLFLMIIGYLWLSTFSDLSYDHHAANLSAAIAGATFLLPAVIIRAPLPRSIEISGAGLERLLTAILAVSILIIVIGGIFNFRVVSLFHIYDFRDQVRFPTLLGYSIGITSSTLLPFAFACFWLRGALWRAGSVLLLLMLFYPLTLSKNAFFAPFWLVYIGLISKLLGSRLTVVVSLALPLLVGVALMSIGARQVYIYSHIVNLRLFAIPSNAMDFYNEFFAHHEHTYFCQISFLKSIMSCPYREPLSVIMQETYGVGFLNASLFATEGVASVGILYAPVISFVCGLVIAFANGSSAGLPSRFVLISGGMLPIVLSNVPLSTTLLTHGAALMFLLWYVMPRDVFAPQAADDT